MRKIVALRRELDTVNPELRAQAILQRLGFEHQMPVPILEVCESQGLAAVRQTQFRDVTILVMIRCTPQGPILYVNRQQSPAQQRFTAAHALGHFLLHLQGNELHLLERDNAEVMYRRENEVNPREREANVFAAALLMPRSTCNLVDLYPPRQLAQFLAVSLETFQIRLRKLRP